MKDIEIRLKECLQQPFESSQRFLEEIIFPVFGEENFESAGNLNVLRSRQDLQNQADASGITSIHKVGDLLIEGSELGIFDITIDYKRHLQRNRVGVQQIIRTIISSHSGAFIIFHYQSGARWEWRFTFCHKGASNIDSSDAKRYTYLLGPGVSCRTAAENFVKLHEKIERDGEFEMGDIIRAFDVEALSKEFFTKYKIHYERFCQFIYNNKDNRELFGEEFSIWEDKIIRDYVKKLLGRIVFLHFLQKKGWLGVPKDKPWGEGDPQFMKHLFEASNQEQKENFLDCILEPLFSNALNTKRNEDLFDLNVEGFRNVKIPYLNGGLFERDYLDEPKSKFPAKLFEDLFEFFYEYNFTIDENDPNDAEVGIDPEMLGRIFENLLEDNKDKGAFYTPKEIVQYMCRESLIAYLVTCIIKKQGVNHQPEEKIKDAVRLLLNKPEEIVPRMTKEHLTDFGSYIRNIKVCDPAIGSGAFPMGLLNELVRCRSIISAWATDENGTILTNDYAALKADIICNNIYGVDIEKGAIDIARLRFWLSIIVDEQVPHALPNFDYKFLQGNSLIPTFDGQYINLGTKDQRHRNVPMMIEIKKKILELKNKYYIASGDKKLKLNIQIKDYILQLISLQLGYEIKAWAEAHADQLLPLFPGQNDVSLENAISQLPADKRHIVDLGKYLRKQLADESIPLSKRSQIDICFFDWKLMFTEVFDTQSDRSGFDIVIGNPPYISAPAQIANPVLAKQRESIINCKKYESLYQKWDLYIPFIEHGIQLANKGGIVAMIVPYPLTNQTYGKKLREMIVINYDLLEICDLNGTKVFENATVSNCIPFIRKNKPISGNIIISHIDDQKVICRCFSKMISELVPDMNTSVWNLKKDNRNTKKHSEFHVLGDFCYISKGMVINADEKTNKGAFKKEDLISLTQDEIHCRKYIEAKDMEKYCIKRVRFLEYNTERCPNQLSRPTFRELYEYPKLMFNRLGNLQAYYDEEKLLTSDAMFCAVPWHALSHVQNKSIISSIKKFSTMERNEMEELSKTVNLKFLLGVMNSKYTDVLLTNLRAGDYHIYPEHIRNIAIPNASKQEQQAIITLVEKILFAKKENSLADISTYQHQIDMYVYHLYGLTNDEIAAIDTSV